MALPLGLTLLRTTTFLPTKADRYLLYAATPWAGVDWPVMTCP